MEAPVLVFKRKLPLLQSGSWRSTLTHGLTFYGTLHPCVNCISTTRNYFHNCNSTTVVLQRFSCSYFHKYSHDCKLYLHNCFPPPVNSISTPVPTHLSAFPPAAPPLLCSPSSRRFSALSRHTLSIYLSTVATLMSSQAVTDAEITRTHTRTNIRKEGKPVS